MSSLLHVRLFRRSCGVPCAKYLTNDRLHSMTDTMTFYREEEHQDLHLIAEVKALQNVMYRLSFQVFYDQLSPIVPLEREEVSLRGLVSDSPQLYNHTMQSGQYVEINLGAISHHYQSCLNMSVGYY